MANKEKTPTDASCVLRSLGGELKRSLGLLGAGVGLEWGLLPCVLLCSLVPFQREIWVTEVKQFSGVQTPQPQLHPCVSGADLIPQAGYSIWEQSKRAKNEGKGELPWDTGMRHSSWLSWRHVTPQPPVKNSADGIGKKNVKRSLDYSRV